jgi:hypothetical protein
MGINRHTGHFVEHRNFLSLTVTAISEPIVYKMWEPQRLTTQWFSTARYRDTFNIPYLRHD